MKLLVREDLDDFFGFAAHKPANPECVVPCKNLVSSVYEGKTTGQDEVLLLYGGYIIKLQLIVDGLVVVGRIRRGSRRAAVKLSCNGVGDVLDFLEFLLEVLSGS